MRGSQEHQWRREEQAELDAELRLMSEHRSDCLCRAVKDWSPSPTRLLAK